MFAAHPQTLTLLTVTLKIMKNPTPDIVVGDMRFPLCRSMIVSGPSGSGKSHFVTKLLTAAPSNTYFTPTPRKILWYYGEVRPKLNGSIVQLEFRQGLPSEEEVEKFHRYIIVLDDLLWESRSNMQVGNLFTRVAHHRECFIIHITQNLFQSGAVTRTQSLNAHYFVLFKNPRDRMQITYLARQIYPDNSRFLVASYDDATREAYGYLLVDVSPTTKDFLRLRTHILLDDKQYIVYMSK